jgi:hypothetical protein
MKSIWKYQLTINDDIQTVHMPAGARVVFVADQDEEPTMWAEVDGSAPTEARRFRIHGTGHPIYGSWYVGTAICGRFVWHVYEVTP